MTHVVFAVPFAMDATLRFVQAACRLRGEGLRLGVLSQDPIERFPADLRSQFDAFHRVPDAMDAGQLAEWVGAHIASFRVPKYWDIRRERMPRNAAGKVLKHVLTGDAETPFIED